MIPVISAVSLSASQKTHNVSGIEERNMSGIATERYRVE